jgi:modulator of FtsH protease HflK
MRSRRTRGHTGLIRQDIDAVSAGSIALKSPTAHTPKEGEHAFEQWRVSIDQVQLLKVDPPTQVIDAFRDVQAARADKERLQNEAGSYANKVVPEARREAERILQAARAYKEQAVAEATGQSARFLRIYEEYKKAPEVTRKRMYLETMERVLGGTNKIILDTKGGQGVLPYLSRDQLHKP